MTIADDKIRKADEYSKRVRAEADKERNQRIIAEKRKKHVEEEARKTRAEAFKEKELAEESRSKWATAGYFAMIYCAIRIIIDFLVYAGAWRLMGEWFANRIVDLDSLLVAVWGINRGWVSYTAEWIDPQWGGIIGWVFWLAAVATALLTVWYLLLILKRLVCEIVGDRKFGSVKPYVYLLTIVLLFDAAIVFHSWIMSWWGFTLFSLWLISSSIAWVVIFLPQIWSVIECGGVSLKIKGDD